MLEKGACLAHILTGVCHRAVLWHKMEAGTEAEVTDEHHFVAAFSGLFSCLSYRVEGPPV